MNPGKRLFCLAVALFCALTVQAAGDEWLVRLRQAVRALGDYEVQFDLTTTDGYAAAGSYRVSGTQYAIAMPGVRVFCDGSARYEVNDSTQEVVIDAVNSGSNNLLDNPVQAFDFVAEQYAVQPVTERPDRITLRLTPRANGTVATIVLTLDRQSALPVAVTYGAEDMQIEVKINSFKKSATPFPAFRRTDFPGYEWIDFR